MCEKFSCTECASAPMIIDFFAFCESLGKVYLFWWLFTLAGKTMLSTWFDIVQGCWLHLSCLSTLRNNDCIERERGRKRDDEMMRSVERWSILSFLANNRQTGESVKLIKVLQIILGTVVCSAKVNQFNLKWATISDMRGRMCAQSIVAAAAACTIV